MKKLKLNVQMVDEEKEQKIALARKDLENSISTGLRSLDLELKSIEIFVEHGEIDNALEEIAYAQNIIDKVRYAYKISSNHSKES